MWERLIFLKYGELIIEVSAKGDYPKRFGGHLRHLTLYLSAQSPDRQKYIPVSFELLTGIVYLLVYAQSFEGTLSFELRYINYALVSIMFTIAK